MAVAISDDGDVFVCVGDDDVYESIGDGTGSDSSGVDNS
jgi:hypothetical protein